MEVRFWRDLRPVDILCSYDVTMRVTGCHLSAQQIAEFFHQCAYLAETTAQEQQVDTDLRTWQESQSEVEYLLVKVPTLGCSNYSFM